MKRIDLIEKIKEVCINDANLQEIIENEVKSNMNVTDEDDLKKKIKIFITKLRAKYKNHHRIWSRVLELEKSWLEVDIYEPDASDANQNVVNPGPGRSSLSWEDASERTKRRKVLALKENNSTLALASAALSRSGR